MGENRPVSCLCRRERKRPGQVDYRDTIEAFQSVLKGISSSSLTSFCAFKDVQHVSASRQISDPDSEFNNILSRYM